MNLKILLLLLMYWSTFIIIFTVGGSEILTNEAISHNINLNDSDLTQNETQTTGGIFGVGLSFGRWFALVGFGMGLVGAPDWFQVLFGAWQTMVTIFTVGFVIASIWNG